MDNMNTNSRTPLYMSTSVGDSLEENGTGNFKGRGKNTNSPRRVLVVLAIVGSLLVVGGAGYTAFKRVEKLDDASAMNGLDAIGEIPMEEFGAPALENNADVAEDAAPAPGTLLKCWKQRNIYVVMNGKKRPVPNMVTYKNLFGVASSKIAATPNSVCRGTRTGKRITNGARLIRCKGYPHVMLHSNRQKRWICNPTTFKAFKFNGKAVKTLSVGECNKICNGPTICNNKGYKKSKFYTQLNTVLGRSCPAKMIAQYSCPPGSHETGVDNLGNCICKLCPRGFRCSGGYRSKQKCGAGSYQPQQGQAMCIPAAVGYYVPRSGSWKQFLCPRGHYSNRRGATACKRSSPGWMIIMVNGVAVQKKCQKGTYQSKAGQHKCVPASPGYYVPRPGYRFQIPCRPGMYQMRRGSFACVKASAGYFVAGRASARQFACHLGTYQPKMGQRGCRMAAPGFYVGKMGSKMQMACPKATYQHCSGQTRCISCPKGKLAGHYLPRNAQKQCGLKVPLLLEEDDNNVDAGMDAQLDTRDDLNVDSEKQ